MSQRKPEKLDYLGVSYGLTQPLLKFWRKAGFTPVYISQVANNLTGEHTTIMIKALKHDENEDESPWLRAFYSDFRRRLVNLLGYEFRAFPSSKCNNNESNAISKVYLKYSVRTFSIAEIKILGKIL